MYKFTGEVNFQLKKPYLSILKAGLELKGYKDVILLTDDKLKIDGYFHFEFLKDLLLFIQKITSVKKAFILCCREQEEAKYDIVSKEGIFYLHTHQYNEDKIEKLPFAYFIEYLGKSKNNIQFDLYKTSRSDIRLLGNVLSFLRSSNKYYEEDVKELLYVFIKNNGYLELIYDDYKILLNDPNLSFCYRVPFEASETGKKLESLSNFFQSIVYDEKEKRKMKIGKHVIPLIDTFMEREKKNIILDDHTIVDSCSQCIFRVKKITDGCKFCIPKKQ